MYTVTALSLALLALATSSASAWWTPARGTTFNINLIGTPTNFSPNTTFEAYDLDLFNTANQTVRDLKASGHKVICYFSAGTTEDGRPDLGTIPASAKGNELPDYPGEFWLDTTNGQVRRVMTARIALAAAKGCDAVDPDNVDAYDNDSGLSNLDEDTATDYVTFLADAAHARGLASGLKNAASIVPRVVSRVDFCVNEQCAEQRECPSFGAFADANKPVFEIEYTDSQDEDQMTPTPAFLSRTCVNGNNARFSVLIKHLVLDKYTALCPDGRVVDF